MTNGLLVERSWESSPRMAKMGVFQARSRLYLMDGLPPVSDSSRLELELKLVPEEDREDAMQIAWLAHLEGEEPAAAVNRWWASTRRRRRMERTNEF